MVTILAISPPAGKVWLVFGQPELLHYLSLSTNRDIKSRITYSASIKPLNDDDMERYIVKELEAAKTGINTFDEAAMALIIRCAEGNLRLCRNLCYASLIEAARETRKIVTITHVNMSSCKRIGRRSDGARTRN